MADKFKDKRANKANEGTNGSGTGSGSQSGNIVQQFGKSGINYREWEGHNKRFSQFWEDRALVKSIKVTEILALKGNNVTDRNLLEGRSYIEGIIAPQLTQRSHRVHQIWVHATVENRLVYTVLVIKLSIKFPLQHGHHSNDIALFFKRFITILFAANRSILLEK